MAQGGLATRDAGGPVLDRSHLHVLLCDKDPKTAREVLSLLRRCSYQVTAVKTARQVIDVLNSNVSEVDLILTEVELPKEKGFKMIKHIMRQERLKRIPIVMMSARDEMAVVVKCLKLGAADYLVKPLRTNELLNLWTHMWRRRRLLGLAEKHIINGSLHTAFDLLISDTSESNNTNSTNLFSDDTDDKMRITSTGVATALASYDFESEMSPQLELSLKPSSDLSVELISHQCATAGFMYSPPRKSELKLGQSSAFLSYSKASKQPSERSATVQSSVKASNHCSEQSATMQSNVGNVQKKPMGFPQQQSVRGASSQEVPPVDQMEGAHLSSRSEHGSGEVDSRDSVSVCWNNSSLACEITGGKFPPGDQFPVMHFSGQYESHGNVTGISSLCPPQFVNGGILRPTIHSSPGLLHPAIHLYHGLSQDETAGMTAKMPPIHALLPAHGLHLNTTFPYYPLGLHMASAQLGPAPSWPAIAATPLIDRKLTQAERREAALSKFRRKRKDRCFEKKIRYVSRKMLAEQRPRVRGQFVRRTGDMDMNDNEGVDEYDEEEEDDGRGYSELGPGSSPESMARDTGNGLQCPG